MISLIVALIVMSSLILCVGMASLAYYRVGVEGEKTARMRLQNEATSENHRYLERAKELEA